MTQKPFISFIVPVYNVERYLRECIESIIGQTVGGWELILVDDGATDGSGAICDEYAENNEYVRVIHKLNGGVSTARNAGLDAAQGEWIWFIDSDDYVERDALETLMPRLEGKDFDLIQFILKHLIDGKIVQKEACPEISGMEAGRFKELYPCWHNVTMLFRKDIIEAHRLRFTEGIKLGEDMEFQVKYLCFVKRPAQFSLPLYIYRIRENSATQSADTRRRIAEDVASTMMNTLDFVELWRLPHERWFAMRMAGCMRNILYSASLVKDYNRKDLQKQVCGIIDAFNAKKRYFADSRKLQLAYRSVSAYIMFNKYYLKLRGLYNK